jgi:hypothetical protein
MGLARIDTGTGTPRVPSVAPVNVTVAVFFDGTGNNMYNTDARNANKNGKFEADSSYESSYSNVARLFKNYNTKKPYTYSFYIEGIGTLAQNDDDVMDGTGLGRKEHGVPARVADACKKIADVLLKVPQSNGKKVIGTLTVDVFGFSRGAAAARHFIYEITKAGYKSRLKVVPTGEYSPPMTFYTDEYHNETKFKQFPLRGYLGAYCEKYKIQLNILAIRFAGLFDTVASYSEGIIPSAVIKMSPTDTPKAFTDDTKELKLNAVSKARKAVQLSAADEHRANFPLTNINSAAGRGVQLSLPGVHSDIGGSYENESTKNYIDRLMQVDSFNALHPYATIFNTAGNMFHNKLDEQAAWLVSQGWYKKEDLHKHTAYGGGLLALQYCLSGTKPALPNTYSFIPLYIMCRFALEVDVNTNPIPFNLSKLENISYPLKANSASGLALLKRIKGRLMKYAFENGQPVKLNYTKPHFETVQHSQSSHNAVDHTYVKPPVVMTNIVSPEDKDLLDLRYSYLHFSAKYDRRSIARVIANYPRMINGKRQRLVLPG